MQWPSHPGKILDLYLGADSRSQLVGGQVLALPPLSPDMLKTRAIMRRCHTAVCAVCATICTCHVESARTTA